MKIFLSSTFEDLVDYRESVRDALLMFGDTYRGMEYFGASEHSTIEYCLQQIEKCDLVIAILGTRYGTRPNKQAKSFTHQELDYAIERKIPVLGFFIDEDNQPILKRHVDQGEDAIALHDLKDDLRRRITPAKFTTPHDLARKVMTSLYELSSNAGVSQAMNFQAHERVATRFRETAYDQMAEWYDYWYEGHWSNDEPRNTICTIARSFLESVRGNISNMKILDCACGTGNTYITFRQQGFTVFGSDGSREMLRRANENCNSSHVSSDHLIQEPLNWTNMDGYLKYFDRESFDLIVITANSFCHIPPTSDFMGRALSNFHKLLKQGGLLFIDTKRYVGAGTDNGVAIYRELQYDPSEKEWVIRREREESRELPGWGEVKFHTRIRYDFDPAFKEKTNRALIVVTIHGEKFSPKTLVVPYYPLPAQLLAQRMLTAEFSTTVFRALEGMAVNWKYDIVVGKKR